MNLSDLVKNRIIQKIEPDKKLAVQLLSAAEKDLITAEDNLKLGHLDWALAIAYNAMLSAGRALMAFKGFRPSTDAHHLAAIKFCSAILPSESSSLVASFNRYRVRRHNIVYGEAGSVSETEAKNAIENAKKLIEKIKSMLD